MREIDDGYPTLDVFDAIHRELVTIIGHCTFHRSVLQDLILRQAHSSGEPAAALERWREESIQSIDRLRFSDLHKRDKALASAVYDEASRTAETFWNVLLSQTQARQPVRGHQATLAAEPGSATDEAAFDDTPVEAVSWNR